MNYMDKDEDDYITKYDKLFKIITVLFGVSLFLSLFAVGLAIGCIIA